MNSSDTPRKLIDPSDLFAHPLVARLPGPLRHFLIEFLAIQQVNRIHAGTAGTNSASAYIDILMRDLDLNVAVLDRESVPHSGGVVVACNHPSGIADGMVVATALLSLRKDLRLLGNSLLCRIDSLRDLLIPIDPFGGHASVRFNVPGLLAALHWLRLGGALLAFPAGEVAHFQLGSMHVLESAWDPRFARFLKIASVPVLPAWIEARPNSFLFHAAGLAHPLLRTALLLREFVGKQGTSFSVRFGRPESCVGVTPEELATRLRSAAMTLAKSPVPYHRRDHSTTVSHSRE